MERLFASSVVKSENLVIFGAGKYGQSLAELITSLTNCIITAFLDNKNYGIKLAGCDVFNAEDFLNKRNVNDYMYIIGGNYSYEMYHQLRNAGVSTGNIYSREGFLAERIRISSINTSKATDKSDRVVVFDCFGGFVMGGVEKWTYDLCDKLEDRQIAYKLYTSTMSTPAPNRFADKVLYYPAQQKDFITYINELSSVLAYYDKVTFILAHCNLFASAVMVLRKIYPEKIKVVSIIHSSLYNVLVENVLAENYVDQYVCVNHFTYEKLSEKLQDRTKALFKETPIDIRLFDRKYHLSKKEPITIGYAARLEREHKRSDLIPELLEAIEKTECNYLFQIAGDGKCYSTIQDYVIKKGLSHKVQLLGTIPYEEMNNFWERQDIAVNISETEGCSLSMLESMERGCVQLFTDIPGTDWFIENGKNGYLVPIGDMDLMASKIAYLESHRDRIPFLGQSARDTIVKKCNREDYAEFFIELLN